MDIEFDNKKKKALMDIRNLYDKQWDTSTQGIGIAAGPEAQTTLLELMNPIIQTPEHRIQIFGKVYLASTTECIKVLSARYVTPRVNLFPKIVKDILEKGTSKDLSKLSNLDLRDATKEIQSLERIFIASTKNSSVCFLQNVDPLTDITEYIIDGKHTSGIPLKAISCPLTITSDGAKFSFSSSEGVKISDGRLEKNMIIDLISPEIIVNSVSDNVSVNNSGKNKVRLADTMTILAILLLGLGVGGIFTRKLILMEIGFIIGIGGALLFWIRFYSSWALSNLGPSEINIKGEAPMEVSFSGELS